jgi:hypothetical protein
VVLILPAKSDLAFKHTNGARIQVRSFIPDNQPGWRKSSFSWQTGNCIEVAGLPAKVIGVRDSQNSQSHVLRFTSAQWDAFVGGVRDGKFGR